MLVKLYTIMNTISNLKRKALLIIIVLFFLANCEYLEPKVNWYITIPNNYTGFLIMEYRCVGGIDLEAQRPNIRVRFNDDGTFCTSSDAFSWSGLYHVSDRSGREIIQAVPSTTIGYAFLSDGVLTTGMPPTRSFATYWVGDMTYYNTYRNTIAYQDDLDRMLREKFGLVKPKIP